MKIYTANEIPAAAIEKAKTFVEREIKTQPRLNGCAAHWERDEYTWIESQDVDEYELAALLNGIQTIFKDQTS